MNIVRFYASDRAIVLEVRDASRAQKRYVRRCFLLDFAKFEIAPPPPPHPALRATQNTYFGLIRQNSWGIGPQRFARGAKRFRPSPTSPQFGVWDESTD